MFDGITLPCLHEVLFERYEKLEFWSYTNDSFASSKDTLYLISFYQAFHEEFKHDFVIYKIIHSLKFA